MSEGDDARVSRLLHRARSEVGTLEVWVTSVSWGLSRGDVKLFRSVLMNGLVLFLDSVYLWSLYLQHEDRSSQIGMSRLFRTAAACCTGVWTVWAEFSRFAERNGRY